MTIIFGNNVINEMPESGPIRLWDSGVEWARLQAEPDRYDWSRLDDLVNRAGNRSIMMVLGHPPEWAAAGGSDGRQASWMLPGSNRPPKNSAVWNAYVGAVVSRYKNSINTYQVWNEPADPRFYTGDFDVLAMYAKLAYRTIKDLHPSAKVVSPPLQPRRQAGWAKKGKALIESLAEQKYPFDIWAAHIYPQIGEGATAWVRDVRMVQKAIPDGKPLWITETNFNLVGPGNPYPVQKQKQLLDTIRLRCYALGIPRVYWYGFGHSEPHLFAITQT
jgi:polysaccharide biosynthesis protein PslG